MTQTSHELIEQIASRVRSQIGATLGAPATKASPTRTVSQSGGTELGRLGQFDDVDQAVAAAQVAQRAIVRRSLAQREQVCQIIRDICCNQAEELGLMEYEETRIGHAPHKIEKLRLAAQLAKGTSQLRTECFSGDHGISLEERGAWGVIGTVTPVTHSLPTVAINAINMIAAGNSLVCNPHPSGRKIAAYGARLFNQAIHAAVGIDNLICVIVSPTLKTAEQIFTHPGVAMLTVTGGMGVVDAALRSGKRAVCAGPGNPPVVVDESADLENAARCVIEGASYDNNLFCFAEKEVFVVDSIFDAFMAQMAAAGAHRLSAAQMDALAEKCIGQADASGHRLANRKFVGAEPGVIAQSIGVAIPPSCRLIFGEVGSNMHPFVQSEQMMPVLPVVRCRDFAQAVAWAKQAEHGFRHTAIIHSKLVDHMTHMGREMDTTLFVKNGPSLAGDGAGGEGYGNYTIACTSGEGVVTPNTFTRFRRCVMVDNLRIV